MSRLQLVPDSRSMMSHARSSNMWVSQLISARLEPPTRGFVALGVPIGHAEFVQRILTARLEEERRLLQELQDLPDMQSAWLLLLYCANPRARHVLRTVPPQDSVTYAAEHDRAVGQRSSTYWRSPTRTVCSTPDRLPPRRLWWPRASQRAANSLGSLSGCAPGNAAKTPGRSTQMRARTRSWRHVECPPCLRAAAGAGDKLLAEGWECGMPCSAERRRRPRTRSPQSPEASFTAGRNRQVAYSTLPIGSASFAACRRVLEL